MAKNNLLTVERNEAAPNDSRTAVQEIRHALPEGEAELLREVVRATRMIRYGSITLTLHDGRIVEIQKTERIRSNGNNAKFAGSVDAEKSRPSY